MLELEKVIAVHPVPTLSEFGQYDVIGEVLRTKFPDRVIEVMNVAEPGLFKLTTRLPVAFWDAVDVTPPYNVADVSVTVFTFEPKRPNV